MLGVLKNVEIVSQISIFDHKKSRYKFAFMVDPEQYVHPHSGINVYTVITLYSL